MTNRRTLISGAAALVTTGLAAAADKVATAPQPGLEFVLEELVTLEPTMTIGDTPYGLRRRVPITGGSFEGPRLKGKVLPGGADWQLRRPDGYTVLEAEYMLQAQDGALIHLYNKGLAHSVNADAATRYIRTVPVFEAPNGPHEWLNQAVFIGTLVAVTDMSVPAVRIRIYKVT
jgi:hypothetical protein